MRSKNLFTPFFRNIALASLFIISLLVQISCSKSSASEKEQMTSFAAKNNITYVSDPSGVLYQIITAGNNNKPKLTSTITVTYTGKLMNDKTFDSGTITYPLNNLIPGWQIALPFIGEGGQIKILIPSSLGYGSSGSGEIPGNSPLYFDVSLSKVK
ncbi:MAG: FKBP-type peptidyl-prolyl cis-trans isomerase [Chitinophagaceae bacterium]|jgi:FKBP-type peptidyl-prolyl cis-trans isomerase FkpA|nr:FKBP-type peptidyl-prolyl cis-trans isomerase [Chitinophagaceae bacterium]